MTIADHTSVKVGRLWSLWKLDLPPPPRPSYHLTSDLLSVDTGLNVRNLHKHIICFCFKLLPGRLLESQLFMSLKKIPVLNSLVNKGTQTHTLCNQRSVSEHSFYCRALLHCLQSIKSLIKWRAASSSCLACWSAFSRWCVYLSPASSRSICVHGSCCYIAAKEKLVHHLCDEMSLISSLFLSSWTTFDLFMCPDTGTEVSMSPH